MRRVAIGAVLVLGGAAIGVPALAHVAPRLGDEGCVDKQVLAFLTPPTGQSTSSLDWTDIEGLSVTLDAFPSTEAVANVNIGLSGAAAGIRVLRESNGNYLQPGPVRFDPTHGTTGFSFTFEANVLGTETWQVQWRSPTGSKVTLIRGLVNVQFATGTSCFA